MTKYERHIRQLCKENKIEIRYTTQINRASMVDRIIWIKKSIKTIKPYYGALHEISHILIDNDTIYDNVWKYIWQNTYGKGTVTKHTMDKEVQAWKTTLDLAKWWSPVADKLIFECLLTYIWGFNQCHVEPYRNIPTEQLYESRKHIKNRKVSRELVNILLKIK